MNLYLAATIVGLTFSVFPVACDDSGESINTPRDVINKIKNGKNKHGSSGPLSTPRNQEIIVSAATCDYCEGHLTFKINSNNGDSVLVVENHVDCKLASERELYALGLLYGWGNCSSCSGNAGLFEGRSGDYIEYRSIHSAGCPNESPAFAAWRFVNPDQLQPQQQKRYLKEECKYCGNKWWSDEIHFMDDYHKKGCRFSKPLPFSEEL